MECFECTGHLNKHEPDVLLVEEFAFLLVVDDLLIEVPIVCELHYYADSPDSYHKVLLSMNASMYPIMFVCRKEARILT